MKERLVKGTTVEHVVRALRRGDPARLPELGPWEQDLLRKRVSRSTWYSLSVFESLMQVVHRYVLDGSEAAAQNMGRSFAQKISAEDRGLVAAESPLEALVRLHTRWRELYNFGEVGVVSIEGEGGKHGARVRLTGFPDMSACQGHAIIGWAIEAAEESGAIQPVARIEERPWMHNSVLTFVLEWS